MIDFIKLPENEHRALCYAEKYGIVEYKVKSNRMIYKVSYPLEHVTMKCIVDLTTMQETRTNKQSKIICK